MTASIPIPKRPLSQNDGPLRRDTKKIPNRLSKRSDRHSSDISLPIPESLSDLGVSSTANSYEVKTMDILHPRPTLRYSQNPRISQSKARDSPQHMIVEQDYHSRRKIDDLANDLDARALRELMERDQRRRERKRKTDQARLEEKLKRRAEREKHKQVEKTQTEAIENVTQPGLAEAKALREGRERTTSSPTDPFSETAVPQPPELRIPSHEQLNRITSAKDSKTALSPVSPSSSIQQTPTRTSISHVTALPVEPTETSKSRRASGHGNRNSFTSLFRRSTQAEKAEKRGSVERGRHTSPETPAASRESRADTQVQQSQVMGARTYRRSGTPQRTQTQSRFKEDLPELPISPPDSRVHSPEVGSDQSEGAGKSSKTTPEKTNGHPENKTTATGAPLSEELATVDAEATWLSGKPTKKPSVRRENPLKAKTDTKDAHRDSTEDADVTNDPYFRALSPEGEEIEKTSVTPARKASSTALNMDEESDAETTATQRRPPLPTGDERWHSSVGKHPQLVRQPAQARSKEGLLKEYQAHEGQTGVFEDETSELDSPDLDDIDAGTSSPILRAQSVNYGGPGHARHISAGSAKLLDIVPTDSKRSSMQRSEKVPTPNRAAFTAEDIQKRL